MKGSRWEGQSFQTMTMMMMEEEEEEKKMMMIDNQ